MKHPHATSRIEGQRKRRNEGRRGEREREKKRGGQGADGTYKYCGGENEKEKGIKEDHYI